VIVNLQKAEESAKKIKLTAADVETLEDAEAITSLAIPEVLNLIEDPVTRADVTWLQKAHVRQNNRRWVRVADQIVKLFAESCGAERVKQYHELEQLVADLNEEEIRQVEDLVIREALVAVKQIHTHTRERMTRLVAYRYEK